jgi:hypothetical protein
LAPHPSFSCYVYAQERWFYQCRIEPYPNLRFKLTWANKVSYARTMDKGTPHNILTELKMTSNQYNLVTTMYYVGQSAWKDKTGADCSDTLHRRRSSIQPSIERCATVSMAGSNHGESFSLTKFEYRTNCAEGFLGYRSLLSRRCDKPARFIRCSVFPRPFRSWPLAGYACTHMLLV